MAASRPSRWRSRSRRCSPRPSMPTASARPAAAYLRETADAGTTDRRWTYASDTTLARDARRRGLLRAHRAARHAATALAARRLRADQEPAAGNDSLPSPPSTGQPRRAGAGALRAARGRRSAHPSTPSRAIDALLKVELPAGPVLAPLQRRRLWRARGRRAVRRHWHRPALAAVDRRARALRAGGRQPRRGRRRLLRALEAFASEAA